jgi:Caspase domain
MLLAVGAATGALEQAMAKSESAMALVFYASQSGKPTLDQGQGGGNPFASALVQLLERPSLTSAELYAGLPALTKEKSRGFQVPEGPNAVSSAEWRLKPIPTRTKRVALVAVYSDYSAIGVSSLPGAERDLQRVSTALGHAGFKVQATANPSRDDLHAALEMLSAQSEDAEAAAIYVTGHGFEHRGHVYLVPNDIPFARGLGWLPGRAIDVRSLVGFVKAKRANLVFFGGCRTLQ